MCRSTFSILSYGELDPSGEQGLNLNSVLFTLDEGSRRSHIRRETGLLGIQDIHRD